MEEAKAQVKQFLRRFKVTNVMVILANLNHPKGEFDERRC
jgi:hypothetical protein